MHVKQSVLDELSGLLIRTFFFYRIFWMDNIIIRGSDMLLQVLLNMCDLGKLVFRPLGISIWSMVSRMFFFK